MKKLWTGLLVLMVTLALVLSGCSKKTTKTNAKAASDNVTPAGHYPIVKKPITLTILVNKRPTTKDLKTNDWVKWYEKKTNIHIKWEVAPQKDAQQKLNLVLSSGKYPDVILGFGISPAEQMVYGQEGVFLPLNQYIQKYGYGTKNMFQQNNKFKEVVTAPNGKIYGLPHIDQNPHTFYPQKMWIYKPWLDKLGLKMPTTTEEFYKVLMAFKTQDPNGNGKADEIPLSAATTGWHTDLEGFLMSAFIPTNAMTSDYKLLKNGKIEFVFDQPQWKQGLEYLHKLYAHGLLYKGSFTQDIDQEKQLGEHPKVPILGAAPGGTMAFTQINGESGRWKEYVAVPPLKGPSGLRVSPYKGVGSNAAAFVITKASKHPAAAFRWADMMLTKEVTLRNNFGFPGKEWKKAAKGEKGLNGKQGVWETIPGALPVGSQNMNFGHIGPFFFTKQMYGGRVVKKGNIAYILYNETVKKYEPYGQNPDTVVPPLFLSSSQAAEAAQLHETIYTYWKEMFAKFVTGKVDINSGWDSYIKHLKSMNIDKLQQIYQKAYDAQYKK